MSYLKRLVTVPVSRSLIASFSLLLSLSVARSQSHRPGDVVIDHRYANTDAQSLIGLPLGSHKTTVERDGSLRWSQWSLKRKPLDTPIGFSSQMDGALSIEPFVVSAGKAEPLTVRSQTLYKGRYPFILSQLAGSKVRLTELAFSVDPDQDPTKLPVATSGTHGLDLVRLTFTNDATGPAEISLKLSGRERNLPGHASVGRDQTGTLINRAGEDVALVDSSAGFAATVEDSGLTLTYHATLGANQSRTLWLRLPYEWSAIRNSEVSNLPGEVLLTKAVAQWDDLWSRGTRIHYPEQKLNDFFDSSIAYVLILTEYDAQGDLWALDVPPYLAISAQRCTQNSQT